MKIELIVSLPPHELKDNSLTNTSWGIRHLADRDRQQFQAPSRHLPEVLRPNFNFPDTGN